ncbi:MAG: hypothetical protein JWM65_345 [Sphingomonas bacterium]|nr:hypothetical protein [Sphingomonas bacterium]
MMFHFSIYHCGALEAVASEWAGTRLARAEAFRLLELSTDRVANDIARDGQTRVVVSDDDGTELFTLTYVAMEAGVKLAA